MFPEIPYVLPVTETLYLIEEARNAELCRDIKALQEILQSFWNNYDCSPEFDDYPPEIRAELLRLCGFFLTFYGRSQNKTNYQEKARDLLTIAVEIFESSNLSDKAAEARIIMAFCYWNTGEVKEAEANLDWVDSEYSDNKIHPVYLQAQINRLLILTWEFNYQEGIKLIEKISGPMEFCRDSRLRAMFHSEAAIIYRRSKLLKEAAFHFNEAIRLASNSGNQRFIAVNYNNLSLLYRDTGDFSSAHKFAEKAIKLYTELGDTGWIPHVLDTKALIYIDEQQYSEALRAINRAIRLFETGEDTNGFIDALWTKVRCLLRLGETEEALFVFGRLQHISIERVGEVTARKFAKLFSQEIYMLKGLPLEEEINEFKKAQVRTALIESDLAIVEAARKLKLKSHQNLSDILKNKFPELYDELGFSRRLRHDKSKKRKTASLKQSGILEEGEISRLNLTGKRYGFNFDFRGVKIEPFYFDEHIMSRFGIKSAAVVAVDPHSELKKGKLMLVLHNEKFISAKIEFDKYSNFYFIVDERGEWVPIEPENVIGEPVGYCGPDETGKEIIKFSKLPR